MATEVIDTDCWICGDVCVDSHWSHDVELWKCSLHTDT